jgi:hypothetical protein
VDDASDVVHAADRQPRCHCTCALRGRRSRRVDVRKRACIFLSLI